MGNIDVRRFAIAVTAARKHVNETQADFGRRFEVGRQTVARWEVGAGFPNEHTREVIRRAIGHLPAPLRVEIEVALGADPPAPPPAPPQPAPAARPSPVDVRAVMEGIVFRVAEELDLGPRGVRAALANALGEMDRHAVSVEAGHEALRARARDLVTAASPVKAG